MQPTTTPIYPASPTPDHLSPSLFELLAQDQLRDLLHPVVRYVLSYLAQHYPRYFLRVLNHHEEFFAGLLLLVERHHLKKHNLPIYTINSHNQDASLSEHFYQLRLAPTRPFPTPLLDTIDPPRPGRLNRKTRWGLLLFLVGLPYVRARAQDYYERLGGGPNREGGNDDGVGAVRTTRRRSLRLFKLLYPYLNLALDTTFLAYDVAYLFNKTAFYRPWHRLLGVRVIRDDGEGSAGPASNTPARSILSLSNLPPLLPTLLLLLKLSQWWYSPVSPRSVNLPGTTTDVAKVHASLRPPKALPILPGVMLYPYRHIGDANGETEDDADGASSSSSSRSPSPETPDMTLSTSTDLDPFLSDPESQSALGPGDDIYNSKSTSFRRANATDATETVATVGMNIDADKYGKCPLCGEGWKNPAVLPSGWVVCWRCGWDAVEGEGDGEEGEEGEEEEDKEDEEGGVGEKDGSLKEGKGGEERRGSRVKSRRKGRKGTCPITGVIVGKGQLRRVLV